MNTSTILSRRIADTVRGDHVGHYYLSLSRCCFQSALSKYYGISPPTTSRQCEKYLDVPELAADRGAKKLKKKKARLLIDLLLPTGVHFVYLYSLLGHLQRFLR